MKSALLDAALLRRLEHLTLQPRQAFLSGQAGVRRSRRRGLSIEFADYREYRPGDDLRYVDWKAYARLERLYLKLFLDEEDLSVHLLIDCSKSMSFGEPLSKWAYAQRAAAAIGFIALHENSRVDIAAFDSKLAGKVPPLRGDQSVPAFLSAIEKLSQPDGEGSVSNSVKKYATLAPPAGLVVIFSDFFDDHIETGLAALAARRHQVVLVQVLDRGEVQPGFTGDVSLVDAETGKSYEVALSDYEIAQYRARFAEHTGWLMATARKLEMDFLQVVTDEPVEELVFQSLRGARLLDTRR